MPARCLRRSRPATGRTRPGCSCLAGFSRGGPLPQAKPDAPPAGMASAAFLTRFTRIRVRPSVVSRTGRAPPSASTVRANRGRPGGQQLRLASSSAARLSMGSAGSRSQRRERGSRPRKRLRPQPGLSGRRALASRSVSPCGHPEPRAFPQPAAGRGHQAEFVAVVREGRGQHPAPPAGHSKGPAP